MVGLALPVFGAQHLGLGLCGIAGVIQRVAQALGQRVRVGGVLGQQVEFKGALAQHAGQQQVRLVGHQRHGLLLAQHHAGDAQQLQQVGAGGGFAQHVVEPVAHAEGFAVHGLHGVVNQALGTGQQPGHVAPVVLRGLRQQLVRPGLAHKMLQALAGPVPVDHEDDARCHVLQAGLQLGIALRLQPRLAHKVGLAGVEPFGNPGVEHLPAKAHVFKHLPEKPETAGVQVGVGERDRAVLHLDDQHVDVVGADVVLDQQAWAVACDGGVEPGVRKLQLGRAVQAAHEGAYQRAVIVLHLPGVGAVHVFGGHFTRQCIDLLVQVHDQQVQAVAALAVAVGQFGQCGAAQALVVGQGMELAQPVVSPHGQRVCAGLPGVAQGAGHGGEVV